MTHENAAIHSYVFTMFVLVVCLFVSSFVSLLFVCLFVCFYPRLFVCQLAK